MEQGKREDFELDSVILRHTYRVLLMCDGDRDQAAAVLGVCIRTLRTYIQQMRAKFELWPPKKGTVTGYPKPDWLGSVKFKREGKRENHGESKGRCASGGCGNCIECDYKGLVKTQPRDRE